jgi:hypothetical protein
MVDAHSPISFVEGKHEDLFFVGNGPFDLNMKNPLDKSISKEIFLGWTF